MRGSHKWKRVKSAGKTFLLRHAPHLRVRCSHLMKHALRVECEPSASPCLQNNVSVFSVAWALSSFRDRFSIVPMAEQMPRLLAVLTKAQEDPDHKVIVFFVAARVVQASPCVHFASIVSSATCHLLAGRDRGS